jgi:acyl carrier protein
MEKVSAKDLILLSLKSILSEYDEDEQISIQGLDGSTRLIGSKAVLDSMGLVSLLIDVEQKINESHNINITIADERAMSQEKSPFRTVNTLTEYVDMLIQEQL